VTLKKARTTSEFIQSLTKGNKINVKDKRRKHLKAGGGSPGGGLFGRGMKRRDYNDWGEGGEVKRKILGREGLIMDMDFGEG